MSLSAALSAATSGLRTTQAGLDVVSQNIANAGSVGYSRRVHTSVQTVADDRTTGARSAPVQRLLDLVAQRHLRLETAGASYTGTTATYADALQRLFGEPGSAGALDTALNDMVQGFQAFAANPGDFSARSRAVDLARGLAQRLASVAEGVQALRSETEARIGEGVTRANDLLKSISEANARVVAASSGGPAPPALLDERDRLVDQLSTLVDVRATAAPNGAVRLATSGGQTLFDGVSPIRLAFDGRGALSPQSLYAPAPGVSGVGRITGSFGSGQTDLIETGAFRSGEIGALLKMRDDTLVEAQAQLDELAAGLAAATSERRVTGTPVTNGLQVDLAGIAPGDVLNISYVVGGVRRDATVIVQPGAPALPAASPTDPNRPVLSVNFGSPPTAAGGAANLAAALGAGFSAAASGTTLQVTATAAGASVEALSFSELGSRIAGGAEFPPLFSDGGSAEANYGGTHPGALQRTGLAQRLILNPEVAADPKRLLGFAALSGDATRPLAIVAGLSQASRVFSGASGVGGGSASFSTSLADFARRVVDTQGANAEAAQRLDEGQKVALSAIESRFADTSGVSIDQEMSQLVQLQTAYGANARVITAIKEMMDLLLRI